MKQYLVFVNYNYTPYVLVRWDRKHKPILNPPTMFYTDTRPPKYYKSFNRAEITQRKLQKCYPECNVYIEVVEDK